jgi:hypothetical protein
VENARNSPKLPAASVHGVMYGVGRHTYRTRRHVPHLAPAASHTENLHEHGGSIPRARHGQLDYFGGGRGDAGDSLRLGTLLHVQPSLRLVVEDGFACYEPVTTSAMR